MAQTRLTFWAIIRKPGVVFIKYVGHADEMEWD